MLTNAGREFLSAENDTEAYALGCISTLLLACAGLWAWNRMLFRDGPDRAEAAARWGARSLFGLAGVSLAIFWVVLVSIGPGLAETRRVPAGDVLILAAPGLLSIAVVIFAYANLWLAAIRRST